MSDIAAENGTGICTLIWDGVTLGYTNGDVAFDDAGTITIHLAKPTLANLQVLSWGPSSGQLILRPLDAYGSEKDVCLENAVPQKVKVNSEDESIYDVVFRSQHDHTTK